MTSLRDASKRHHFSFSHYPLLLVLALAGGCVTVRVDSQPPGAKIYVNNRFVGETPFTQTFIAFEGIAGDFAAVLPGHDLSECPELAKGGAGWAAAIRTAPAGAIIYKNGRRIGTAPMYDTGDIASRYNVVWPEEALSKSNDTTAAPHRAKDAPNVASDGAQATPDCDLATLPGVADLVSVAVLDFRTGTAAADDAGMALADLCRETVQASRRYVLLDRETMKALLSEEDFAATFTCDDTQCLVNYGRKLRAQKIIHGRISRVGETHLLTVKLIDVGSAAIEALRTAKVSGSLDRIMDFVQPTTCELLRDALSAD